MSTTRKKTGWRDRWPVHPVAEVFPMLGEQELRDLGEDIKANGLKHDIVLWIDGELSDRNTKPTWLLDGRNRLAAMELVGLDIDVTLKPSETLAAKILTLGPRSGDPASLAITYNLRRRHLTKQQQAALIVKVAKAAVETESKSDIKDSGQLGPKPNGRPPDPVKAKATDLGAEQGISERTVKRALADDRKSEQGDDQWISKQSTSGASSTKPRHSPQRSETDSPRSSDQTPKKEKKVRAGTHDRLLIEAAEILKQIDPAGLSKAKGRKLLEQARNEFYRIEDGVTA